MHHSHASHLIREIKLLNECIEIGYYDSTALDEARAFKKRQEATTQAVHVLEMASSSEDSAVIASAIAQAEDVGYKGPELIQCKTLLSKIQVRESAGLALTESSFTSLNLRYIL